MPASSWYQPRVKTPGCKFNNLQSVFAFMGMTKLNHKACRNLEASVLHQAIKDVAYGGPEQRELAQFWIDGPNADHIAEQLGITNWPPDEDCYNRERKAYLKRRALHLGAVYGTA